MPALVLVFALLLPQQVQSDQIRVESLRGRVILVSNSTRAGAAVAPIAAPTSVEMVRAPAGHVLGDPLWPGLTAREAAPPAIMAEPAPAMQAQEVVPVSERIAAARQTRGSSAPPPIPFYSESFRERLAARVASRPAWVAPVESADLDDGGLPQAYRIAETEPAFQIQQASGALDPMPLRIVQTSEVTLYFSEGAPVFLRVAPDSGGGCFLEFDYGLDGHRSVSDEGVYWLEMPNAGRAGVTVPSDSLVELNLSEARVGGCPLPDRLSLHRSGRVWSVR
ncbi:MAG: hypothetical protein HKN29_02480 [Rhodothermales bacterium]|nr:hypothetical protein [Rhodothermales bacterium]